MNALLCFAFLCQSTSIPFIKTMRINYKLAKRKSVNIIKPLQNSIASYDIKSPNYNSSTINKNIRVKYKIAKKKTNRIMYEKINLIIKNQNDIIDKSVSLISDNIVNEILYLLKFYHLTNDNINAYMYILAYELTWIGYKIIRINTTDKLHKTDEDTEILYKQVVVNILMYILIKNIFMNTIVKVLNHNEIL
tara:strand:+ start:93 stop:668 length:576 start_codon:yes stop_codon:yes gene_type:complete